jgi:hypothetical protein
VSSTLIQQAKLRLLLPLLMQQLGLGEHAKKNSQCLFHDECYRKKPSDIGRSSQRQRRKKKSWCLPSKFLPRPENVEGHQFNGFRLAKLQMCPGLNSWEREFIQSLARQGYKLSPKQQAVFDGICLTYLQEGSAP